MCILEGAAAQGEGEEEEEEENEEVKQPKEPCWRTVCSDDPQDVWDNMVSAHSVVTDGDIWCLLVSLSYCIHIVDILPVLHIYR